MNPRHLLESGWHELTRVGAKPDIQDYAQMTSDKLKDQLKIICDLQDNQKREAFEWEEKIKQEEDELDKEDKKLLRQFKIITKGLKSEGQKYNWLEKPKPFNGLPSQYS
jgi:hypothetical protein